MSADPDDRPTMKQILHDRFFLTFKRFVRKLRRTKSLKPSREVQRRYRHLKNEDLRLQQLQRQHQVLKSSGEAYYMLPQIDHGAGGSTSGVISASGSYGRLSPHPKKQFETRL